MDNKISNIMMFLSNDFSTASKQTADNSYEIEAKFPAHKVFLKLEVADDILRVNLEYLFGCISEGIGTQELLHMLTENVGAFGFTSSFLGLREFEGTFYTVLNGYYLFHMKWNDRDIAEIISLALADINMNFGFGEWPNYIYRFSEKDLQ